MSFLLKKKKKKRKVEKMKGEKRWRERRGKKYRFIKSMKYRDARGTKTVRTSQQFIAGATSSDAFYSA